MTDNRVAVVTGAASGIGRGCALRLAADGYRVAVVNSKTDSVPGGDAPDTGTSGRYPFSTD